MAYFMAHSTLYITIVNNSTKRNLVFEHVYYQDGSQLYFPPTLLTCNMLFFSHSEPQPLPWLQNALASEHYKAPHALDCSLWLHCDLSAVISAVRTCIMPKRFTHPNDQQ